MRYSQRRRAERLLAHRHGLRGTWNSTDQVPARAVDDGRHRPLRHHRRHRRRRLVPLQRLGRLAAHAQQRQHQGQRLRHRLRPEPVLELHLLPRRSRQRRPVPPGRSPLRLGRQGHATGGSGSGAAGRCRTSSALQLRQRRHRQRRAVSHGARASRSRPSARTACGRPASAASRRTRRSGRRGCGRWPACASTATASTSTPASRPTPAPTTPAWSARRAASCSGRGEGTEFYVNAGFGFHSNDARGATITIDPATGEPAERVTPLARATRRRGRRPQRAHPAPADQPGAVDAEPRLRADLHRRCRQHRGRPAEPPLRPRVRQLLLAAAVADARRRPVAVARALHRRRPGRRRHPRRGDSTVVRPASPWTA